MKKTCSLTSKGLARLFNNLEKAYPELLKQVGFREGKPEQICGDISCAINNFLRNKLGLPSYFRSGMYVGRGSTFSGGRLGTAHSWVELKVRLADAYLKPLIRIIIDGAYAQFFPSFTPKVIRDRVRLMIFINDKTALRWYRADGSQSKEEI